MKKLVFPMIAFLILGINVSKAQDNNIVADASAKVRTLDASFTAISVTSGIQLTITQGNEESIAVSISDERYYDRFKTEVEDGVLKLYFDQKGWRSSTSSRSGWLKAYVSFKTLNKLTGSGGAIVKAKGTINTGDLGMHFTSGSIFEGTINAKDMNVDQNSGANIKIEGKADRLKIDISSGASWKGYGMIVDNCDAKASSGASIQITVNKEITGKASSGASVRFKGEAVKVNTDTSNGAVIKKA